MSPSPEYVVYQAIRRQMTRPWRGVFIVVAGGWGAGMRYLVAFSPDPARFLVVLIGTPLVFVVTGWTLLMIGWAVNDGWAQVALEIIIQHHALDRTLLWDLTRLVRRQVQQWNRPWDVALLRACERAWQQIG